MPVLPNPYPPPPECPSVVLPQIACTQALRLYIDAPVALVGAQTLENVFTINDGPPPYTLLSADITGIQQAIVDQSITAVGMNEYRFTGTATVYMSVDYEDGLSDGRSKFVKLPVPLSVLFQTTGPVSGIVFYSELVSGTIANPVLTGTTLTLNANVNLRLLGASNMPERLAVLSSSCDNPPPAAIPTACTHILPSSNTVEGTIPVRNYFDSAIPFDPDGATEPYTVEDMESVATAPNVLSAVQIGLNRTTFVVSFPVRFTIVGDNGVRVPQESELFTQFALSGISIPAGVHFLLDIRPVELIDATVFGNVVEVLYDAEGSISVVAAGGSDVLTTPLVDCGDAVIGTFIFTSPVTTPTSTPPPPE